jgi:hypothetical protein
MKCLCYSLRLIAYAESMMCINTYSLIEIHHIFSQQIWRWENQTGATNDPCTSGKDYDFY